MGDLVFKTLRHEAEKKKRNGRGFTSRHASSQICEERERERERARERERERERERNAYLHIQITGRRKRLAGRLFMQSYLNIWLANCVDLPTSIRLIPKQPKWLERNLIFKFT